MKHYEEIKKTLTRELGFRSLDDYRRWVSEERDKVRPTTENIARLSPDLVDCRAFWKVCGELFGHDPICNQTVPSKGAAKAQSAATAMESNRLNLLFAKQLGVTSFIDQLADMRIKALEIGPGYGSLKNYIEAETRHEYIGVDVVARVPGVIEATADGLFSRELVAAERGQISYVVSSNVFQHLSKRQRSSYIADTKELLQPGGLLIFNLRCDLGQIPASLRDGDGNAYCDHYGQYTEVPRATDLQNELKALGFETLYLTQRYDGVINFTCQKPK